MIQRIRNRIKRLWPFSIKFYAFTFILLMSIIFGVLGWGMQYKLDSIREEATQRNHQAALDEIRLVLNRIEDELKTRAQTIAVQDETRQQYYDSAYYHYWRDIRMLASGSLPGHTRAIELYTAQGNSLSDHPVQDMPLHVSQQEFENFITRHKGVDALFVFYAIPAQNGAKNSALGYIGFKVDVMEALKSEQRYSFTDIDSLHINITEGERIPLGKLESRLEFELIPSSENNAITTSFEKFQRQILGSMIVLYFVFYLMLSTILSAPLRRLSLHIDALRNGQSGLLSENYTRGLPVAELEKVRLSLNDYQTKLEEMHLSLSEKNDELWQLAHHDPLTGIYNRRGFEEDWKHMLAVSSGHRLGVALILFDCDHFKAINDTYGHPTGDQVIRAITQSLQHTLRHGDRLYRIGGDEFAAIFLDIEVDLALHTAERCIDAVSQFDFSAFGIKEPVRISAGLAYAVGTDIESLTNLPKQADVAMYHAKRPGKSKIAVYERSMAKNTDILFSSTMNNLVFKVMASDDSMEMHYQPIANLHTGEIDYYEALVRIRDGSNLIMPSTIFPIIAERRLETEFDMVVLGRIAKDLASGKIPAGKGVSFNVSGPGVVDPQVQDKINELADYLDRYKLIIEVTETALITQLHLASSILNQFRQKGFRIALDDFGSGYSSLSYLSNMPVDCVKFDVSLVRQLFDGNRQGVIIENLAAMVGKAGYDLIAEGVETEEVLHKVTQIGFHRAQGFLFGRASAVCAESLEIPYFNRSKAIAKC